jgi:hypothetical protein
MAVQVAGDGDGDGELALDVDSQRIGLEISAAA